MQYSKKRLKQLIIERYVENPLENPEKIALELGVNLSWTNTVIDLYKIEISLKQPLYITKSIDLPNTYYLFTESGEKKIETDKNIIQNIEAFTDYERTWLYLNKGLR